MCIKQTEGFEVLYIIMRCDKITYIYIYYIMHCGFPYISTPPQQVNRRAIRTS